MARLSAWASDLATLRDRLQSHPEVALCTDALGDGELAWIQGADWRRSISVGADSVSILELVDNNPLVCADDLTLPTPAGTLASIAVGPLIRAGLLCEPPALLYSFVTQWVDVESALANLGWEEGAAMDINELDLNGVLALTAFAEIPSSDSPGDLDVLYDEAYQRSFYVHRDEESPWDSKLVAGKSHAVYRLRYTPGEDRSLLTIQVMSDETGKCGAAQVVHAFNVMCGFEESLGVDIHRA